MAEMGDRIRQLDWPFLAVFGLGLGLRLVALTSRSIEYDDAFSIFLAQRPLPQIVSGTAADTMPPLYYFLLHAWMRFGQTVGILRALNVFLSMGIVGLSFSVGRALWDRTTGLWLALFTAASPFQIFHAQGMRMYVVLTLAALSYLYFFARLWAGGSEQRARNWLWPGLVVSGAAAMYSHNLAIFTLAAPVVLLLVRRQWSFLTRLLAALALIGLAALPWLVQVPGQIAKVQAAFWTPRPGLLEALQAIITFHTNLPVPDWMLPIAVAISLQVCVIVGIETARGIRHDPGAQLLTAFFLVPPMLLFAVSYLMRPVFVPRAFMLSSVAYYGLLARAMTRIQVRAIGYLAAGAYLVSVFAILPAQYSFATFPRSPFQRAAEYLDTRVTLGDRIVHDNKLSYFPARFYAPDLPQVFLADRPGSTNDTLAPATQAALDIFPVEDLPAAVAGAHRVWFVVFDRAVAEYAAAGASGHPQLDWLENHFELNGRQDFNDLSVYIFSNGEADR